MPKPMKCPTPGKPRPKGKPFPGELAQSKKTGYTKASNAPKRPK